MTTYTFLYSSDTHSASGTDERLSDQTNGTHINKLTLGPQPNNNNK